MVGRIALNEPAYTRTFRLIEDNSPYPLLAQANRELQTGHKTPLRVSYSGNTELTPDSWKHC